MMDCIESHPQKAVLCPGSLQVWLGRYCIPIYLQSRSTGFSTRFPDLSLHLCFPTGFPFSLSDPSPRVRRCVRFFAYGFRKLSCHLLELFVGSRFSILCSRCAPVDDAAVLVDEAEAWLASHRSFNNPAINFVGICSVLKVSTNLGV